MSQLDQAVEGLLNRYPQIEETVEKLAAITPDEWAKLLAPWVRPLLLLTVMRLGTGRLVKLTGALNEAGVNVPALDKRQARAIWGSASSLVALLAYRAAISSRAASIKPTPAAAKDSKKVAAERLAAQIMAMKGAKR
jgi:hypothetical protein